MFRQLNRVRYFPIPDLDAYNLVKDLFNKGIIPFESSINIDYDTYREIREKIGLVVDSGLHKIFDELGRYRIEQDLEAEIVHLFNGIYIKFLLSKLNNEVISFYILYKDEPKLYMDISARFPDDIDRVIDIIANWYSYVVKAIEKGIEALDNLRVKKNIDSNKINFLKDYLSLWLNIVSRYRDEFEKNKVFT
ncbi:MAG: hypothetical protein QXX12_06820 [Nanopusillaceae archaeon]